MIIIRYNDKENLTNIVEIFDTATEFKNYIDRELAKIEVDFLDLGEFLFEGKPYNQVYRDIDFYDKLESYLDYIDVRIEVV